MQVAQWENVCKRNQGLSSCMAVMALRYRPPMAARACKVLLTAHQRLSRLPGLWWQRLRRRPRAQKLVSHCLTQTDWRACSLCHHHLQPQWRAQTPLRECKGLRANPEQRQTCLLSSTCPLQGSGWACTSRHAPLLEPPRRAQLGGRGRRKMHVQTWQAAWPACSAALPSSTAPTFLFSGTAVCAMRSWKARLVCHASMSAVGVRAGSQPTALLLRYHTVEITNQHALGMRALMLRIYGARAP